MHFTVRCKSTGFRRRIEIDERQVRVVSADGEESIPTRTVLWAAGVTASTFARTVAEAAGARDRPGGPGAGGARPDGPRASGDLRGRRCGGASRGRRSKPTPGVAQGAMQGGSYAAKVIRRRVLGRPYEPFRYSDHGDVAVIGRLSGVTNISWLGPFGRQGGFTAWLLWLGIHIFYLIGFANRIVVLDPLGVDVPHPRPRDAAHHGPALLPPIEEPEPPVIAPLDDEGPPGARSPT